MFVNVYKCINCEKELNEHQVYGHCDGRCPKCGHKEELGSIVVACTEHAKQIEDYSSNLKAKSLLYILFLIMMMIYLISVIFITVV